MNKFKLAEILHRKNCSANHVDDCDWYYYGTKCIGKGYAQNRYLEQAEEIIKSMEEDKNENKKS